ncbi:MAG TPA: sigma factor [Solirubrobacterales bacterium]|jgi:DNA-directed RNA polymerase specialized sigma24 family protein|nr:sigma factor [Solirubrobacterales bacterium]
MTFLNPQSLTQHVDRLYRAAWAMWGSREDAEDLTQETFARVLAKPRVLSGDEELYYLMRVLRNTFFTHRRTASRRLVTVATLDDVILAERVASPAEIARELHLDVVGTFLQRADHHLTRLAFNIDEDGWIEATAAYMELYERIFEIQEAAARMRDGEEKPFRVVSFQSLFEIPMKPE